MSSPRTIIRVVAGRSGDFAFLDEGVAGVVNGFQGDLVNCQIPSTGHPGDCVYNVFSGIPEIRGEIDFTPATGQPPVPLYLSDNAELSQTLPWEAIRKDGQFLGLEGARPLGRIAETTGAWALREDANVHTRAVRILAVISAAGVDGLQEWTELYNGLLSSGMEFELSVFVAEDRVEAAVKAAIAAETRGKRLTCQLLATPPGQVSRHAEKIIEEITRFDPNIVHFLCHGMILGGRPVLELATRSDHDSDAPRGSVILDEFFFDRIAQARNNIWLVLLNCCNGAIRGSGVSMARRIVEIGFPAAVGMRAEVKSTAAAVFAGEFYRTLGRLIVERTAVGEPTSVIDWVTLLTEPRRLVCTHAVGALGLAETVNDWIHPVIYVRRKPFTLIHTPPDSGLLFKLTEQLQTLETSREGFVVSGMPSSLVASVDEEIARVRQEIEKLRG